MTIDKAIEVLTQASKEPDILYSADFIDALKLGIDALKVLSQRPFDYDDDKPFRLLGETEE